MSRRLFRSRDDRMIAGVAGGLAELWDADPSLVRIIWVILVPFTGGFALLAYVIMALVVPEEDEEPAAYSQPVAASASLDAAPASTADGTTPSTAPAVPAATPGAPPDWRSADREARAARRAARRANRRGPGSAGVLIGALLVIAGTYFLVREYIPAIDLNWLGPAALIALGVVVLVSAFRRPPSDTTSQDGPR